MKTNRAEFTKDEQAMVAITLDMANAQSASEIMKHWDKDVVWFDITARFLKGYEAVYREFDEQFGRLECCGSEIKELFVESEGNLGIVNTVQHFWDIPKGGTNKEWIYTRQTDIFRKIDGEWKVIEQHISTCLRDL